MIDIKSGASPLIISIPHAGLTVPESIKARMTTDGRELVDTDWYVDRLFAFAHSLDITLITAEMSRYVIDLNRDPNNISLYPGEFTTSLCPTVSFAGKALYKQNVILDEKETSDRMQRFWSPYHQQITEHIMRIKENNGYAILLDAHSIASTVPTLFDGTLPELNFGTNDGYSCCKGLINQLIEIDSMDYNKVLNGRFKGGYITRTYGQPEQNVHAVQLEIAQNCYMDEQALSWNNCKAQELKHYLQQLCQVMLSWRPA